MTRTLKVIDNRTGEMYTWENMPSEVHEEVYFLLANLAADGVEIYAEDEDGEYSAVNF